MITSGAPARSSADTDTEPCHVVEKAGVSLRDTARVGELDAWHDRADRGEGHGDAMVMMGIDPAGVQRRAAVHDQTVRRLLDTGSQAPQLGRDRSDPIALMATRDLDATDHGVSSCQRCKRGNGRYLIGHRREVHVDAGELAPPLDGGAAGAPRETGAHGGENLHQSSVRLCGLKGIGYGDRPSRRDGERVQVCRGARVVLDGLRPRDITIPSAHPEAARRFLADRCPPTSHRCDREAHVAELAESHHLDDEVIVGIRADEEKPRGEL